MQFFFLFAQIGAVNYCTFYYFIERRKQWGLDYEKTDKTIFY